MPARFSLFLIFFLCGCATYATGPLFTPALPGPVHTGTLYVFRAKPSIGAGMPLVKIDGQPFVRLPAMGYSYVYLPPGVYTLTVERGGLVYFRTAIDLLDREETSIELQEPFPGVTSPTPRNDYRYVEPLRRTFLPPASVP